MGDDLRERGGAGESARADVNDPAVNGQYIDQRNAWWQEDSDWWSRFAAEVAPSSSEGVGDG